MEGLNELAYYVSTYYISMEGLNELAYYVSLLNTFVWRVLMS